MFSLSKLLTPLILPPGVFLLLLLLVLYYLHGRRRSRRALLSLLWLLAGMVYLLSIRPVADSLIQPLESSYPGIREKAPVCGALLVFGGGTQPYGNQPSGNLPGPDAPSALRAYKAFAIWLKSPGQIILSGGSVHGEKWNSAQAMGAFLAELGVPGDYLTLEQESRNTFENAKFTAKLIKDRGLSDICLFTSAYHMPRAVSSLAVFDIAVKPVPTDFKAYQEDYGWRHALPSMRSLGISTLALHEYLGLLFYMLAYSV